MADYPDILFWVSHREMMGPYHGATYLSKRAKAKINMPSQFDITVASLQRLVKEESSYHKELEQQKARLAKLESGKDGDDENLEYQIKQEVGHILVITDLSNSECMKWCINISSGKLLKKRKKYFLR